MPTQTLNLSPEETRLLLALDTGGRDFRVDLLLQSQRAEGQDLIAMYTRGWIKFLIGGPGARTEVDPTQLRIVWHEARGYRVKLTREGIRQAHAPALQMLVTLRAEGGRADLRKAKADRPTLVELVDRGLIELRLNGAGGAGLTADQAQAFLPRDVNAALTARGRRYLSWPD